MNKLVLASASLVALAASANAEMNVRPYVGVDYTFVAADYNDTALGVNGDQVFDDGLHGISPYAGLQFNKYVGAEVSYLRTEAGKKSSFGGALETKTRISGFAADVVGTLPVTADEKLALLGSVGVGRYEAKITSNGFGSASDDDTGFRVGAGAQYQINDCVGIRAMARYIDVDFQDTTDHLVTGSLGVNVKF